jgi:hypothetical protein
MNPDYRDIDQILSRSAHDARSMDGDLIRRIAETMGPTLQRVRPLPSDGVLAGGLVVASALIAFLGAWATGFTGVLRLDAMTRVLVFAMLGLLIWTTAIALVHARIPASAPQWSPVTRCVLTVAAPLLLFAVLFRDYHTHRFFAAGFACLGVGLLYALPMTIIAGLWLRRGWSVNAVAAAGTAGLLGGVTGLLMLELHCPNMEASHVLVWHVLVIPVSAAAAAVCVFVWQRVREMS